MPRCCRRIPKATNSGLWIGYLQWHFRTRGEVNPPEPVIDKFHTIECRDAVLAYDSAEPVVLVAAASTRLSSSQASRSGQENERQDAAPTYLTRWDGHTFKKHPVTGEEVPDESATIPVYRYTNPRPAEWPEADYVVGNPPFIGTARMRDALGDGYTETLRKTTDPSTQRNWASNRLRRIQQKF